MAGAKKLRPTCAEPSERVWYSSDRSLSYRFVRASHVHVKAADRWKGRLVEWEWTKLYQVGEHCLYAVEEEHVLEATGRLVALFALHPKRVSFGGTSTTRLDFIEVEPQVRGTALPLALFAMFARFSFDLGRTAVAISSLPEAVSYYEKMGGERDQPAGWRAKKPLVAIGFQGATLAELVKVADGLE